MTQKGAPGTEARVEDVTYEVAGMILSGEKDEQVHQYGKNRLLIRITALFPAWSAKAQWAADERGSVPQWRGVWPRPGGSKPRHIIGSDTYNRTATAGTLCFRLVMRAGGAALRWRPRLIPPYPCRVMTFDPRGTVASLPISVGEDIAVAGIAGELYEATCSSLLSGRTDTEGAL